MPDSVIRAWSFFRHSSFGFRHCPEPPQVGCYDFMNDVRFAFRQLVKNPGSTVMAVLILALGIGGNTAVFSVADKVLLNPIPGRDSTRLVSIREVNVAHDSHWNVSPPLIQELASQTNLVDSLTYFNQSSEGKTFRADENTVKLRGAKVA